MLSNLSAMRLLSILFSLIAGAAWSIFAATPEIAPHPTVPSNALAADAGKDVVHQLNSAFAKVFETVAPSVVVI